MVQKLHRQHVSPRHVFFMGKHLKSQSGALLLLTFTYSGFCPICYSEQKWYYFLLLSESKLWCLARTETPQGFFLEVLFPLLSWRIHSEVNSWIVMKHNSTFFKSVVTQSSCFFRSHQDLALIPYLSWDSLPHLLCGEACWDGKPCQHFLWRVSVSNDVLNVVSEVFFFTLTGRRRRSGANFK